MPALPAPPTDAVGLGDAAVALTTDLVRQDSVNPGLVPGAAGEHGVAVRLADRLDAAGFAVTLVDVPGRPGRTSLVAVHGDGPRCVVLDGHLDTVGVEGMADPFSGRVVDGRLLGRGACDMKGGVAGLVVAAEAVAAARPRGQVVLALVADEEDGSVGTPPVLEHLAAAGVRPDVCLVGEPTWLDLAVAHRGYAVVQVALTGRAAHSSRPADGVDAVAHLGRLLAAVADRDAALRTGPGHPLLGHGSLMVTVVHGGSAPFTVAAHAQAVVERRTLPGEDADAALDEVRELLAGIAAHDPRVGAQATAVLSRPAWEADADGPAARFAAHLADALPAAGAAAPSRVGAPYWMESALWQAAGVPAVVCGPAGGGLHGPDEWVDVAQLRAYPVAVATAVHRFLAD